MKRLISVSVIALLALGCEEEKPAEKKTPAKATASVAVKEAPKPAAKEEKKGPAFEDGILLGLPTEKSDAPKEEEWKDAPKLEKVPGNSGPTACPIQHVREWARVTCRPFGGNNPTKPKWKAEKIDIVKGKGKDTKSTVKKGGVAILTFPMREEGAVDAMVEYSKGGPKKIISMSWEKGAKGPILKGRTGM